MSPQPERSASRRRVAEREALGVGPQRIDESPQPERSASRRRVAKREALGEGPELYREFAPPASLRPYVACYWTSRSARSVTKRVLPDGCVDILFDDARKDFATVVGTMTEALVVRRDEPARIVAVRFRPGGARPFVGVSMSELRDRRVDLEELMTGSEEIAAQLDSLQTDEERVRLVDRSLRRRLDSVEPPDARVAHAVRRIEIEGGRGSVEALSASLGLSRQHLQRLFARDVGVGTKFFSRIVRFRSALSSVSARSVERGSWAEMALDAGYFDQAHFIDECRALSGLTPTRLLGTG